jgi:peptidoglycan/LPS O-acetylase OafA/YrhL
VLVVLFAASLAWRIGFEALARATDSGFWYKLAIQAPGQFTFFLAGAIAYHRTRLGLTPPPAWLALGAVAAYGFSDGLLHEAVAPIAVGVFAYWAAIAAPYLGRFGRYGDFSYGIYLYHWPVIQTYIAVGVYDSSAIGGVIATLATVLILAVCSWYMLERRFLSHRSSASMPRVKSSAI